jgi:hypothetical protein
MQRNPLGVPGRRREALEGKGIQPRRCGSAPFADQHALWLVALHRRHSWIPFPALCAAGDDTGGGGNGASDSN